MNLELFAELESCAFLCRRLLNLMERDSEELAPCIRGEVYGELMKNYEQAREQVEKIQKEILILQEEQLL